MKEITNINFISNDAPNILLIADVNNEAQKGWSLKHFKNSHNIYLVTHSDLSFYYNLRSNHKLLVSQLDKALLNKFSIISLSFGGFLAYYLLFHLNERVENALIHDFHFHSLSNKKNVWFDPRFNTNNWIIPSIISTPIILLLCKGPYVQHRHTKNLDKIFSNIVYILFPSVHTLLYKCSTLHRKIFFYIFNFFTLKYFWNYVAVNFILHRFKSKNTLIKNLFCYLYFMYKFKY